VSLEPGRELDIAQLDRFLLLTREQAAALCQVSDTKFDEWTREDGFPILRGPHFVRIHRTELDKWLARRAVEANAHRPPPSVRRSARIDARG